MVQLPRGNMQVNWLLGTDMQLQQAASRLVLHAGKRQRSHGFLVSRGDSVSSATTDVVLTGCRMGNAAEPLVATRDGCATVAHADMRGLGTSKQICVAALPSL